MALNFGKGRVFHTVLGHDATGLSCVGFIATFARGTEWAATGKVTQMPPAGFPTAETISYRADIAAMDPTIARYTHDHLHRNGIRPPRNHRHLASHAVLGRLCKVRAVLPRHARLGPGARIRSSAGCSFLCQPRAVCRTGVAAHPRPARPPRKRGFLDQRC